MLLNEMSKTMIANKIQSFAEKILSQEGVVSRTDTSWYSKKKNWTVRVSDHAPSVPSLTTYKQTKNRDIFTVVIDNEALDVELILVKNEFERESSKKFEYIILKEDVLDTNDPKVIRNIRTQIQNKTGLVVEAVEISNVRHPELRRFVESNFVCPVAVGKMLLILNGYTKEFDEAMFILPNGRLIRNKNYEIVEIHDTVINEALCKTYDLLYYGNSNWRLSHAVKDRLTDTCGWLRIGINPMSYSEAWVEIKNSITKEQFHRLRKFFMYANKMGRDVLLDLPTEAINLKYGEYTVGMLMGKILEFVE